MFIEIAKMMHGSNAKAIFSKVEDAKSNIPDNSSVEIVEQDVIGDYKYPNKIFASHKYNRAKDVHEFSKLFSTYEEADADSGENGLVHTLTPDSKL